MKWAAGTLLTVTLLLGAVWYGTRADPTEQIWAELAIRGKADTVYVSVEPRLVRWTSVKSPWNATIPVQRGSWLRLVVESEGDDPLFCRIGLSNSRVRFGSYSEPVKDFKGDWTCIVEMIIRE